MPAPSSPSSVPPSGGGCLEPPGHSPPAQGTQCLGVSPSPVGRGFCCRRMKPAPSGFLAFAPGSTKAGGGALPERHTFPPFPDCSPSSDYPREHTPPHKSSSPQGLIPTHLGGGWGPPLSWLCPSQGQKFKSFQLFSFVPSPPSASHPPPRSLPLGADEPPSSRAGLGWAQGPQSHPPSRQSWVKSSQFPGFVFLVLS